MADNSNDAANAAKGSEGAKRKVVMSTMAKVIFESSSGDGSVKIVGRDVFSVMDCITERLAETKSKEEMEGIKVSVHSFENEEKSDPPKDGEPRWEGPYIVGGAEIEGMSIPGAMEALAKLVLPGDYCMLAFEQTASQCFARSRMDGAVVIATFDGVPAVSPMVNTMKEQRKENIVSLYRTMLKAAEAFRKGALDKFKGLVEDADFDKDPEIDRNKDAEDRARKIVLPSGLPAGMSQKGVVTPEEARKDQVKVVGLY